MYLNEISVESSCGPNLLTEWRPKMYAWVMINLLNFYPSIRFADTETTHLFSTLVTNMCSSLTGKRHLPWMIYLSILPKLIELLMAQKWYRPLTLYKEMICWVEYSMFKVKRRRKYLYLLFWCGTLRWCHSCCHFFLRHTNPLHISAFELMWQL